MSSHTHWKKMHDTNFLGSWDFESKEEKTVTIKSVHKEEVFNPNSHKKEDVMVMRFTEDIKPIICNKTNSKMIESLVGSPYVEDWVSHKIILRVEKVKVKGKIEDGIRVKNEKPRVTKIICEICGKQIQPYKNMSASKLAMHTKKSYGKELCSDCAIEMKNK